MAEREELQGVINQNQKVLDLIATRLLTYQFLHEGLQILMKIAPTQGVADALDQFDATEEGQRVIAEELEKRLTGASSHATALLGTDFPVVTPILVSQETYDQFQLLLAKIRAGLGGFVPRPEAVDGILKVGPLAPK